MPYTKLDGICDLRLLKKHTHKIYNGIKYYNVHIPTIQHFFPSSSLSKSSPFTIPYHKLVDSIMCSHRLKILFHSFLKRRRKIILIFLSVFYHFFPVYIFVFYIKCFSILSFYMHIMCLYIWHWYWEAIYGVSQLHYSICIIYKIHQTTIKFFFFFFYPSNM